MSRFTVHVRFLLWEALLNFAASQGALGLARGNELLPLRVVWILVGTALAFRSGMDFFRAMRELRHPRPPPEPPTVHVRVVMPDGETHQVEVLQ